MATMPDLVIRPARSADAASLAAIYNHYITQTSFTFEEHPLSSGQMNERLGRISAAGLPWRVAESAGVILAYAYAGPWRERSAYRHSVEVSAYVQPTHSRLGLGSRLYRALLEELIAAGLHTAIGVVPLPNPGSVALHERLGFAKVAHLQAVGFKFGRWIDVGYWQRMLAPDVI